MLSALEKRPNYCMLKYIIHCLGQIRLVTVFPWRKRLLHLLQMFHLLLRLMLLSHFFCHSRKIFCNLEGIYCDYKHKWAAGIQFARCTAKWCCAVLTSVVLVWTETESKSKCFCCSDCANASYRSAGVFVSCKRGTLCLRSVMESTPLTSYNRTTINLDRTASFPKESKFIRSTDNRRVTLASASESSHFICSCLHWSQFRTASSKMMAPNDLRKTGSWGRTSKQQLI